MIIAFVKLLTFPINFMAGQDISDPRHELKVKLFLNLDRIFFTHAGKYQKGSNLAIKLVRKSGSINPEMRSEIWWFLVQKSPAHT